MPSIVVPWRSGDPDRERAWEYCRRWWEQFGWPIYQAEHPGPEPFNRCFSADTDILTRRGWLPGVELRLDDEVAVLVGDELRYERPSLLNVYDYEGEMVHLAGRRLDQMVTPNHRLWVRRDKRESFEFIEASEARPSLNYRRNAKWSGARVGEHVIPAHRDGRGQLRPELRVRMDDWLPFLGWFLSEGHCSRDGRRTGKPPSHRRAASAALGDRVQAIVGITQNEGPKADVIREVLARLPWNVYEHRSADKKLTFEITDRQLWAHLHDGKRAPEKRVPRYVMDLPSDQIERFLEAYHLGDGSTIAGGYLVPRPYGVYGPYEGSEVYYTASPGMADDLSELILKTDGCPVVHTDRGARFGGAMYRVLAGKPTWRLQARHIERVPYVGKVWCPTTAAGIVYVRRNGKACWSGNSWCINEGARRAGDFDVLVVVDADVFADDPEQIRDGVESCLRTGKLTVPHLVGADLTAEGTERLLAEKSWREHLYAKRDVCTSRVWMLRADLFEAIGGFDTRFRGWGHEDIAAWSAAVILRGADQLPGTAWHLWHTPSLPKARQTLEWQQGRKLSERYSAALRDGWPVMKALLDERTPAERYEAVQPVGRPRRAVDVVVLTAGRTDYLNRTLNSFQTHVTGDFVRRTIQDDSGDPKFNRWLRRAYPDWDIFATPGKLGYTGAMRSIWDHERASNGSGSPYIFHLEEDFVFDRDVDLGQLIAVLEHDETLAQVALLRGPWAPAEIRAGGIIEERPDTYEHLKAGDIDYLRHRNFWTTNPCVYRRELIADGWPNTRGSEQTFGRSQWARGRYAAFIGDGTPWVTHIGDERVGRGY